MAVVPHPVPLEPARHVDVGQRLQRQRVEGGGGVLALVDVVGVQVGDVDQQPYPGPVGQLVEELPLRQLLARPGEERRDVLHGERHGQLVLGDPHVLAEDREPFPRPGDRQQVPGLQPARRGPLPARPDERDVLGDQWRPQRLGPLGQRRQPYRIGPLRAAQAQPHPVRHHGHPTLPQPPQGVGKVTGTDVLRHHLHPLDPRHRLDGLRDRGPPADPRTQPFHTATPSRNPPAPAATLPATVHPGTVTRPLQSRI
ncbi:hypothetical protein M2168_000866 [Streptomyces sp. CZ24]|nr:hypothetical protein [Streptomyces sp. CZ24]